jgi:hypothetical protein
MLAGCCGASALGKWIGLAPDLGSRFDGTLEGGSVGI